MSKAQSKVFISHNSRDKAAAEAIAGWLEKNGIQVWFDKWEIQPGKDWQLELEKGLKASSTILIFFGAFGIGPWHQVEGRVAVRHTIEEKKRIIPVLLPDYIDSNEFPEFLKDYQKVDMRGIDTDDACGLILWGITGKNPYRDEQTGLVIPAIEYNLDMLGQYAMALANRYRNVDLLGIPDLKDKRAIPLQSIFVDLECTAYLSSGDAKPLPVNTFYKQESRLVILGAPGAGKSTLLKYLTVQAANNVAANRIEQVPIIVVLRNYARWRTEPGRKEVSLLDYYYWHCNGDLNLKLASGFFERLLLRGLCAVYFDGYDELSGMILRDDICKAIENFTLVKYPRNRFILSSRVAGYLRVSLDPKLFTHIKLASFTPLAMDSFVQKWYFWKAGEQGLSERERDEQITDLQKNLKREQIKLLAGNPMLLTMIAIIHRNEARLPEQRFRLYEKITEALLLTWEQSKRTDEPGLSLDRLRIRLAHLAQWMHTLSEEKEQQQIEVERTEIVYKLTEILQKTESAKFREDKYAAREEAKQFLEFVNLRAGLLIESGDGLYRFLHLSFQEYFTAFYYNEEDLGVGIWDELYLTHIPRPHYKEVLLLLFAMMVHSGKKRTANDILKQCKEQFWERLGIDPGSIRPGIVIKNIKKAVNQLKIAGKKHAADFLVFTKNGLADCLEFDCEEKTRIIESYRLMEIYYSRFILLYYKKINQILKQCRIYDNAIPLSRDLDLNLDYDLDLARGIGLDFTLAYGLARTHELNLTDVHSLTFTRILSLTCELASDLNITIELNLVYAIDKTPATMQEDNIIIENSLKKLQKNCMLICLKSPDFLKDTHERYTKFLRLVFLLIGIIISFHWWYLRNNQPWNYPDLDAFADTGGGLITEKADLSK